MNVRLHLHRLVSKKEESFVIETNSIPIYVFMLHSILTFPYSYTIAQIWLCAYPLATRFDFHDSKLFSMLDLGNNNDKQKQIMPTIFFKPSRKKRGKLTFDQFRSGFRLSRLNFHFSVSSTGMDSKGTNMFKLCHIWRWRSRWRTYNFFKVTLSDKSVDREMSIQRKKLKTD